MDMCAPRRSGIELAARRRAARARAAAVARSARGRGASGAGGRPRSARGTRPRSPRRPTGRAGLYHLWTQLTMPSTPNTTSRGGTSRKIAGAEPRPPRSARPPCRSGPSGPASERANRGGRFASSPKNTVRKERLAMTKRTCWRTTRRSFSAGSSRERQHQVEVAGEGLDGLARDRGEHLLLGPEVGVERGLRHPEAGRDVLHRGGLVAALPEEVRGGAEDLGPDRPCAWRSPAQST